MTADPHKHYVELKEVKELRVWEKCPFLGLIPAEMEIRIENESPIQYGQESILLCIAAKHHDLHITARVTNPPDLHADLFNKTVTPMIRALGEQIFELEFPGKLAEFTKMRRRYEALVLLIVP